MREIFTGLTSAGASVVQATVARSSRLLESNPANCAKYTGSAAVLTRAGYPDMCSTAVTTTSGQAALVADVYQKWFGGSSPAFAQDASVLYQNAHDPGNPQVQAILKTLFGPAA